MDMKERIISALPPLENLVDFNDVAVDTAEYVQGSVGFHPDSSKKRYFTVYKQRQGWTCFRCGVSGDIFDYISIREGFATCDTCKQFTKDNFSLVLERASKIAGIEFRREARDRKNLTESEKKYLDFKKKMAIVVDYYHGLLTNEHRKWVKDKYGFTDQLIDKYQIGFSPIRSGDSLAYLYVMGIRDLAEMGLAVEDDTGRQHDIFRGRIMFPYFVHGSPVFLIGRSTPWTPHREGYEVPKYKKQRVSDVIVEPLFGIDRIRGRNEVIITEGITDALILIQNGYSVLSPVTVRFKAKHIEYLKLMTEGKRVYICNDAEESGVGLDGALSTLEVIDDGHLIILPQDGKDKVDVNSYFLDHTKTDFDNLISKSLNKTEALARFKPTPKRIFLASLEENDIESKRFINMFDDIQTMKKAITVFRGLNTQGADIGKRVIAGAIRRDMVAHGMFVNNGDKYYLYDNRKYGFDETLKAFLSERYEIVFNDEEGMFTWELIKNYCTANGEGAVDDLKYIFNIIKSMPRKDIIKLQEQVNAICENVNR